MMSSRIEYYPLVSFQLEMVNLEEISYGDHALQKIKLFKYDPKNTESIVFIHGGAWRDPNNTYMDFEQLVKELHHTPNTNLVGINYRLSPEYKHPTHLVDVVNAIDKFQDLAGSTKLTFVGHSVGATLLLQLLNYKDIIRLGLSETADTSLPELKLDVNALVFVDGIFDISDLIDEYGAPYKLFVDCAFDTEKHYTEASQVTWSLPGRDFEFEFRGVIVQSTEDELLSARQSSHFAEYLRSRNVPLEQFLGPWGKHEEVYRRRELADIIKGLLDHTA